METCQAPTSSSRHRNFENGSTNLQVERILEFAEVLRLDQSAIMAAPFRWKPEIAHDFAISKLMLPVGQDTLLPVCIIRTEDRRARIRRASVLA